MCLSLQYLPLLLADTRVNSDGREVALPQQLVELSGTDSALDEDDDLVELQVVKQLIQLTVLLLLLQLNVILLETVQGELGVLVHVMLRGVLHELAADGLDMLRQRSREHHDLLLGWSGTENVLDVGTHIFAC